MFLRNDLASQLTDRIIRLKESIFGTAAVEIKSNWIRIQHEREQQYIVPYGLSEEDLEEFIDQYYGLVTDTDLTLLASVVDKRHMQEDYPNPWYAPAVAYDALMQRVENEVGATDIQAAETTSVIIDDMMGATPHGNQYKRNLKRQHEKLKKHGSDLRKGFDFTCLGPPIKFVDSASHHLIQVADIAAYNVLRQFRDYGEEWEAQDLETLPTYDHFRRILAKFRSDYRGRIQGYGIVKMPLRRRVPWGIKK